MVMNNYSIVSHQYKFIYIPIAKSGCTSLLNRIAEIIHNKTLADLGVNSYRDVHTQRKDIFNTHSSEILATSAAIEKYSHYFKFSFVRNPYLRIQSCYTDKLSLDSYGFDKNLITKYPELSRGIPFMEFLTAIKAMSLEEMDEHFRPQYSFFDKNALDFIGKLENISEDWQEIEKILKIEHSDLPEYNKTKKVNIYTSESQSLVWNIYKKDFLNFDYEEKLEFNAPLPTLPISFSGENISEISPFKNIFISADKNNIIVKTAGSEPTLIFPYFLKKKGKGIIFTMEITSPIRDHVHLYLVNKKIFKTKNICYQHPIKIGYNEISFKINENFDDAYIKIIFSNEKCTFSIEKINISEYTLPWLEDKDDLSNINKNIFALPEYVQMQKNLFSMVNYASLYLPILDILKPKNICEIGCDAGNNSVLLAQYCQANQAKLTIIDPTNHTMPSSESVEIIKDKSIPFLKRDNVFYDVYFIDGDHNYQTVYEELNLIKRSTLIEQTKPLLLLIHDTSWPCAYRDLYYNPDSINIQSDVYTNKEGASLYSDIPVQDGLPNANFHCSIEEGGEHNGVKKAVEDFLSENSEFDHCHILSLYGLSILWIPDRLSKEQTNLFKKFQSHTEYFKEFLSILEWNRVALYSQNINHSKTINEQTKKINSLQNQSIKSFLMKRFFS